MSFRKLKALRAEKNISQKEISEHLGITQTTYSFKESGKVDFNLTEIEKIKELFNLPYEVIFFR